MNSWQKPVDYSEYEEPKTGWEKVKRFFGWKGKKKKVDPRPIGGLADPFNKFDVVKNDEDMSYFNAPGDK
jgi:hypothetical protein